MKIICFLDDHFEEILIAVALMGITVIMAVQIVMRLMGSSLAWAEECCRYLFIWCGGLGISYATRMGSHLKLDVIPSLVPGLKKIYEVIADVSMLLLAALLIKPGSSVVLKLFETGQTSAALRINMGYVYMAVLVGLVLTIIRVIEKYIKLLAHTIQGKEV